jgi:phage terminase small subunit
MPLVSTIDGLTPQQRTFAEEYAKGFSQTQAATRAGYESPSSSGRDLLTNSKVQALISSLQQAHQEIAQFSREEFIEGMKEAIEMARLMSDPQTMIVGFRELGRACGFYEAQKIKVEHTVNGTVRLEQLNTMTDEQLLEILEKPALEGEAVRVEEDDDVRTGVSDVDRDRGLLGERQDADRVQDESSLHEDAGEEGQ